nr:MAG TPA: hypothetical protein [Caudoviricetes sp.]
MLASLVNLILFITFATLIVTFHFDGAKIEQCSVYTKFLQNFFLFLFVIFL